MSSTIAAIGAPGERLVSIATFLQPYVAYNADPKPGERARHLSWSVRAAPRTFQQSREAAYTDAIVAIPPRYNCLRDRWRKLDRRYNCLQARDCRSPAPLLAAAHVAEQHPFQESEPPTVRHAVIPRNTLPRAARLSLDRFPAAGRGAHG